MASMANPTLGLPNKKQYQTGAMGGPPPPGTAYRGGLSASGNTKTPTGVTSTKATMQQTPPAGSGKMIDGKWYGNAYLAANPQVAQSSGPVASPPSLSLTNQSNPDPRLMGVVDSTISDINTRKQQLLGQENAVDPNLQFQIDKYKERLGADTTQRAINRVGGALRGQTAQAQKQANAQAAFQGGDVNSQSAALGSASQNRLAKASADISLGRERDLDALTLGGQGIMSAPGQMQFAKSNALNSFMLGGANTQLNAAQAPSQLALQQGQLGLQQWSAQNNAQNQNSQLALQQQQMQQQQQQQAMNQYMQMLSMMYK